MSIRPTIATVDLGAIRHNLEVARRLVPGQAICAVVKADAYGHGMNEVGLTLSRAGVEWLAVALVEEGISLRRVGVKTSILVLGSALGGTLFELVAHNLTAAIYRPDQLEALAMAARGKPVAFHLKIDTGMARLGVRLEELDQVLDALDKTPNLVLDGVLTHFADADLADRDFNSAQLRLFEGACRRLQARGYKPKWQHIANSAAVLSFPEAQVGLLRPGLMIYGLDPLAKRRATELVPAMRWTTRPVHLKTVPQGARISYGGRFVTKRDSRIATLPVGYADGYPRAMSGKAQVLVRGRLVPVVGTICMDLCMADVTDVPEVSLDDEVVLMGRQEGAEVSAYDLATWADTIPYEIICGVGARVPRYYVDSEP
ncbi:MAG: alanine racemase [Deltaproteobacteria bacterium]|nr:alanine racemase [Deltaproteobacteria bacterium]